MRYENSVLSEGLCAPDKSYLAADVCARDTASAARYTVYYTARRVCMQRYVPKLCRRV